MKSGMRKMSLVSWRQILCLQCKGFEVDTTAAKFLEEFLSYLEGLPNKGLLDKPGLATWGISWMENVV